MEKSLDRKVRNLLADPDCGEFILADAKDADMAYGLAAPGKSPEQHHKEGRFRTLAEYRDIIRANVRQGLVDIMLMSVSTNEILTIEQRLFDASHITPAIRANDTTDIHVATGARYRDQPARPFRTALIDHAMCGHVNCAPEERKLGADLGLFSMTFNNNLDSDLPMLNAYRDFRIEAEAKGFRHFLEIFEPNACGSQCPEDLYRFIADNVVRILAGVGEAGRPLFLKMPYLGPEVTEMLAAYDRRIIPGILGGSSGTTFDAFDQLHQARKHGARAALYGRMINNAEHQPTFIQHLRWIADGELNDPAEATRGYHAALEKLGIRPYRALHDDLQPTKRATAYGGGPAKPKTTVTTPPANGTTKKKSDPKPANTVDANGQPDFTQMTPEEKIAWNRQKWNRILG